MKALIFMRNNLLVEVKKKWKYVKIVVTHLINYNGT